MNQQSLDSIINLAPSQKELNAQNRSKTGYNIFVSWFFFDYNRLNGDQKKEMLIRNGIHEAEEYQIAEEDSVITMPSASSADTMRLAASHWRCSSIDIKDAWKERATIINKLPIRGVFTKVPKEVRNIVHDAIKVSLTQELNRLVTFMHCAIRKRSKITDSVLVKKFGKETVKLGIQIYRSFYLNHILQITMFGLNLSHVSNSEIVYKTDKVTVVHIHSKKRLLDLFTINDVCPFMMNDEKNSRVITCAGKVSVCDCNTNKEIVGYVLDEEVIGGGDKRILYVLLEDGK